VGRALATTFQFIYYIIKYTIHNTYNTKSLTADNIIILHARSCIIYLNYIIVICYVVKLNSRNIKIFTDVGREKKFYALPKYASKCCKSYIPTWVGVLAVVRLSIRRPSVPLFIPTYPPHYRNSYSWYGPLQTVVVYFNIHIT